jgi:REP element-mobilizing transposase RayT
MSLRNRAVGWLDDAMLHSFRELLLHTGARYHLHCPAFCLMPDHVHLLWMGYSPDSDQKLAARFLRKHWNARLVSRGFSLQSQAHDRVMRRHECESDAFEETVLYIRRNPERARLVPQWQDWPFGGAILPGYPDVPIAPAKEFWGIFWKIHHLEVRKHHRWEGGGQGKESSA